MNETQKSLIYLLSCSVNGIIPDKARVQSMDLEKLYALAKSHSVQGAVCIALERAGVRNEKFYQAYKKAVRKNIFLDAERTAITAAARAYAHFWTAMFTARSRMILLIGIILPSSADSLKQQIMSRNADSLRSRYFPLKISPNLTRKKMIC